MARKARATGGIEWKNGCWHAKISLVDDQRIRVKLQTKAGRWLDQRGSDEALAREMSAALSAQMRSDAYAHKQRVMHARVTVEDFGEMWTEGKLFEKYGEVRGLKVKKSASDDRNRLRKNIYPYIGKKAVADVTEDDVQDALARAAAKAAKERGKPWRQSQKRHVYQVTRRLFDLAIKPGKLRKDNPVSIDLLPRKDPPKLYAFLYPNELLKLLACTDVPLARRVYYAMAVYTGLRKGSLRVFTRRSLDFEHNAITSLVSKTGIGQMFAQADPFLPGLASLMTLLQQYCELRGIDAVSIQPIVSPVDLGCKRNGEAKALRDDLRLAGITRELLFTQTDTVEPLRFHDLRATFVTWARRAGKGDGWISDRTGHITKEMMNRYDRGARVLADLQYEPFPDISAAIPELTLPPNVKRLRKA
jgi:integrase